jgi:hypothetical protein
MTPAPFTSYFLFVALRALPVFFAVVFLAAAVLRADFFAGFFIAFFAGFFFATAISASLLSGWLVIHTSYIHSLLRTYPRERHVPLRARGKPLHCPRTSLHTS